MFYKLHFYVCPFAQSIQAASQIASEKNGLLFAVNRIRKFIADDQLSGELKDAVSSEWKLVICSFLLYKLYIYLLY